MIEIPLDVCGHSLIHSRILKFREEKKREVVSAIENRKRLKFHGSGASCWKLFYQELRSTHKYVDLTT